MISLHSQVIHNLSMASSRMLLFSHIPNMPLILYENDQHNRQYQFITNQTYSMQTYEIQPYSMQTYATQTYATQTYAIQPYNNDKTV